MQVIPKKVVSVTYELQISKPGESKTFAEATGDEHPLSFLFGTGSMIPKFEEEIAGLNAGETFEFSIAPEDAYGLIETDAIVLVPIDVFKVDGIIDLELLRIGNVLPMRDNDGNTLEGKVIGIDKESATLDFNHPLAGNELHFSGKIIDVRDATAEELAHGHAHGHDSDH